MIYEPINMRIEDGKYIEFYFNDPDDNNWFYEIHDLRNERELLDWDEHLSHKMWYTPEVRKRTLDLMHKLIK
jgi:hypothetical protein